MFSQVTYSVHNLVKIKGQIKIAHESCSVQVWYNEDFWSFLENVRPIEKSFAEQENKLEGTLLVTILWGK